MKRIKLVLVMIFLSILCCACVNSNVRTENVIDTSTESKEVSTETTISEIDGFTKADYELYSSTTQKNVKSGDLIYIEGVVEQYLECDSVMGFGLKDEEEHLWVIKIGNRPSHSKRKVEALVGQEVIVFGSFEACSDEGVPTININEEISHIQISNNENTSMYLTDFASDRDDCLLWYSDNPNEILYKEYTDEENAGTYAMSTGIVENVKKYYDYWIELCQKTEEGYSTQIVLFDEIYYDDIQSVYDFSAGDAVRFYYYINEKNDVEILAIERTEVDFTYDEIVADYKNMCKEYSYEEIARNPENVKGEYAQITGEVIQVIESEKDVELRINITKNKYGNYEDTIYVSYSRKSETEDRILNGDIITVYGKLNGTKTYTSVLGAGITLPFISGKYVEIVQE